jgi:peptide/nickel transport system substrate-binding protein
VTALTGRRRPTIAAPPVDRRARLALLALLALLAIVAAACTADDEGREPPPATPPPTEATPVSRSGGRIVYGLEQESDGWSPATSTWSRSGEQVARAFFDTLTTYDAELEVRPDLAEAVTADAAFTTWTIRLRPGVVLSNGRPVGARAVADGLDVLRAAPMTAAALAPIAAVGTDGDLGVVVTMSRPWATFPHVLTGRAGMVADPDWLRTGAGDGPVGTGPFRLTTWDPGHRLVAARNPDYWRTDDDGTRLPYLDEVEFRPVTDPDVRAAGLRAGTLDVMLASSSGLLVRLDEEAEDGALQFFADPTAEPAEAAIALNTAAPPFDVLDARLALALATDAEAYARTLEDGVFPAARGPFPEDSPWYAPTTYPEPDATAAGELVAAVKASDRGRFAVVVTAPLDGHVLAGMRYLVDGWAAVGIEATIDPVPADELERRLATGAFEAAFVEAFDGTHPADDAMRWHPRAVAPIAVPAVNVTRFADERIGAALDAADETSDVAVQRERYRDVQRDLATALPYVWLYHGEAGVAAADDLADVVTHALPDGTPGRPLLRGTHPLWQLWRSPG